MWCAAASERQRGVALLEPLTALVIAMLVVLSALGTLAFVQAGAGSTRDAAQLQQRIDVALQTIGAQVRAAGAIELREAGAGTVQFSTAFDGFAGQGSAVHGEEGAGGQPDMLAVSREDDGEARDCLGNRPDAQASGRRVDSRFSLDGHSLRCRGAHAGTGSQVLTDGIEDFQVRYGLRSTDAVADPFTFVHADAIAGRWHEVGAVQLCLQVRGDAMHPHSTGTRGCDGRERAADGRLRRVVHATFTLRNRLQGARP